MPPLVQTVGISALHSDGGKIRPKAGDSTRKNRCNRRRETLTRLTRSTALPLGNFRAVGD